MSDEQWLKERELEVREGLRAEARLRERLGPVEYVKSTPREVPDGR